MSATDTLLAELAQAQEQARTDPLTGIGNVRLLHEALGRCVFEGAPFALVLFDVAKMKRANELLGYAEMDKILAQIGAVLRKNRGDGYAVRKGGDEFLLVLPHTTLAAARRVRDRVEQAVGRLQLPDRSWLFLAGGAVLCEACVPWKDCLLAAQLAMLQRKRSLE